VKNKKMTSYSRIVKSLYKINIHHPVKMDLSNILSLNRLLKDPMKDIPIIHVGGTNGKGSVCIKVAESLRRSGVRTGLFVSPHISSFRERVQVNGVGLDEDDVLHLVPELIQLCEEHEIPATFFELTTALAFWKFKLAGCEAVVLEVGLGGKLDATNIITPVLSVLTSVQLDHVKVCLVV
jgi:dihydrofolate synthase/folylpolyglutamate synthase